MMRRRVLLFLVSLICSQALTLSLAWANPVADCGNGWPTMGTFTCNPDNTEHQQICGCHPPSYNNPTQWNDLGSDCYSHSTGRSCSYNNNPVADCGANWAAQGTFSCDSDNAEHQQICGCHPPLYNDPGYWNDQGGTCYTHYTGRQCSSNNNPPAISENPAPPTTATPPPSQVTLPPVPAIPPPPPVTRVLADCGANWAAQGTFSCDATGLQHQQICSCNPPLYNDPMAWIHTQDGCYTHFTGNSCAAVNTLSTYQFVTTLYQNLFGRSPDADSLAYWMQILDSNQQTREQVRSAFITSSDYNVPAFVIKMYNDNLGHPPAAPASQFWTRALNSGQMTRSEVQTAFLSSPDYLNRNQATACTLVIPDCPNAPQNAGILSDSYNNSNVNSANCQRRASDYYYYCQTGQPVIAMFQNHGQTTTASYPSANTIATGPAQQVANGNVPITLQPPEYFMDPGQNPNYGYMFAGLITTNPLTTYTPSQILESLNVLQGQPRVDYIVNVLRQPNPGLSQDLITDLFNNAVDTYVNQLRQSPAEANRLVTTGMGPARQAYLDFVNAPNTAVQAVDGIRLLMQYPNLPPEILQYVDSVVARNIQMPELFDYITNGNSGPNTRIWPSTPRVTLDPTITIEGGTVGLFQSFTEMGATSPPGQPRVGVSGTVLLGPLSVLTVIAPFLVDLTIEAINAFRNSPLSEWLLTPDQLRALDSYIQRIQTESLPPPDPDHPFDGGYTQIDDSYWTTTADSGQIMNDGSNPGLTTLVGLGYGWTYNPTTNTSTFNPGQGAVNATRVGDNYFMGNAWGGGVSNPPCGGIRECPE